MLEVFGKYYVVNKRSQKYMPKENIIEWNDTSNWNNWSLSDFVAWHKGLVRHFGVQKDEKGNLLSDKFWLFFWAASEVSHSYKLQALIAAPSAFKEEVEYIKNASPKIYELSQIKKAVELGALSPIDVIYNAVGTTVEAANDIISGFGTTAKILKYIIPVIIVTAIVFFGIWAYKTFIVKKV